MRFDVVLVGAVRLLVRAASAERSKNVERSKASCTRAWPFQKKRRNKERISREAGGSVQRCSEE